VTTLLVATVARGVWGWPWLAVLPVMGTFLLLDVTFVSANVHKIPAGGWFPLLVGVLALTLMLCWRRGRAVALAKRDERMKSLTEFFELLGSPDAPTRASGTAIYLTERTEILPSALALNLKHNGVVHENVVLLKVSTDRAPRVAESERISVVRLAAGFRQVQLRFGFAEKPDVPAALQASREALGFEPEDASYFLGRETPVPSLHPELPRWQERIYAYLTQNAVRAPDYFLIAPSQVVELGTRVEM
jgi:KUP system potassium uptake protein